MPPSSAAEAEPAARGAARPALRPADVAITGISAIMPGARDLRQFWENILDKLCVVGEVPADRWPVERYFDGNRDAPDKIVSKWGGFLPDISFDPTRFGIPPASVGSIDPAQLLALVAAETAFADAGLTVMDPALRRRASVILGFTGGLGELGLQYAARAELGRAAPSASAETLDFLPEWTSDSFAGLLPNVTAGRIANRFDLGGSTFVVDAACASSLAALRQAVVELESGRSDVVLCGAVEAGQGPFAFTCFSKAQALSPSGRCKAFDAAADGIAISEGVAMIVLRRLEDALAAGDRIYAVIKGIDGSSDGRARGMMAPLPEGQKLALQRAYQQAGYSAASVALFEAHGTGTVSGDAAEIESLSSLLNEQEARPRSAAVGSVKTLIGHAEGAAGLAGLIKVALGLHHRVLPPHAGVETPNAALRAQDCPIALHQKVQPWLPRPGIARRAGVSAFGFGGTNYHVTLEEHAGVSRRAVRDRWPAEIFVWRGADRAALGAAIAPVAAALQAGTMPSMAGLSKALWTHVGTGAAALALVAGTQDALVGLLRQAMELLRGAPGSQPLPPGLYLSDAPLASDGKVAMLFPGQGSQYPDMMGELAVTFEEVAAVLETADAIVAETPTYRDRPDSRLSRAIYPSDAFGAEDEDTARRALAATEVAQPALGAVEAASLALLSRLGIGARTVGGHSYGEYVALHVAGVFDRRDLFRVSEARGRFIRGASSTGDLGTMAAVSADAASVRQALGDSEIVVANLNAPNQTVVSGSTEAIARALEALEAHGLSATRIPVSAAFHSPLVQPAQAPLVEFFDTITWARPQVPVYSNTNAGAHDDDPGRIRALLERHLTEPVDFVGMIEAMYASGARVFLEVGPKSVLTGLTRRILGDRPHQAVALDGAGGGLKGLLHALAAILVQGVHVDLARLFEGREVPSVDLDAADFGAPALVERSGTSWLLNGSRIRKTDDIVRTAAAEPPVRSVSKEGRDARQKERRPVKEIDMHGFQAPVPPDDDAAVDGALSGPDRAMVEHQRTMQQFLQMQERLMMAYLNGGERMPRPFSTPPRPLPLSRPQAAPVAKRTVERPVERPISSAATPTPAQAPSAVVPTPASAQSQDPQALLLKIASEKTGYPEDMLGVDLNMEADLGIDSIKRVEILAAFRKAHPADVSEFLSPRMTQISKSMTLREILDRVRAALQEKEGAPRPFDRAGEERAAAALFRYVIRPAAEVLEPAGTKVAPGLYVTLPDDRGLAEALVARLAPDGAEVRFVPDDLSANDAGLAEWLAHIRTQGAIKGFIALSPAASVPVDWHEPDVWRHGMTQRCKVLFALLRHLSPDLESDGTVLVASAMGGLFARDLPTRADMTSVFPGSGGAVGLVKCLAMEWPGCRCKAVDLDPDEPLVEQAAHLHAELATRAGRREAGYPGGQRTIFRTIAMSLDAAQAAERPTADWVVLAVGGARGITAETLRPFAAAGATCLVVGRTPLPAPESASTASLTDRAALRAHFLSAAAATGERLTPARIEARIAAILRDRETRANMADFVVLGGRVDYRICDVQAEKDVSALLESVYARYGRIDAVLFGAGLIEDRLVVDKTRESLDRVFDTKVDGAFYLARHLRSKGLKFLALFSSVAGRYGNRGQADYGAANEVLNRLAWQLQAQWGPTAKVTSVNWGAWARTTNGPGMLTPETARQFRERGLKLIEPADGRDFLWNELLHAPRDEVEVVAGEHPWDEWESKAAQMCEPVEMIKRKTA